MYVVRVSYHNGHQQNYVYKDMGRAKAWADDLAKAKFDGHHEPPKPMHLTQAHGFDDAGREMWVDGSKVQEIQFVDVALEVKENVRLELIVTRTRRDLLAMAGEIPPEPTVAPHVSAEVTPIRPKAQFAS